MSVGIVNFKQLQDISSGEIGFERELVDMFRQGFESAVANFEDAFHKGDLKGCIHWAHDIKGSSRNIGADLIGQYSERFE